MAVAMRGAVAMVKVVAVRETAVVEAMAREAKVVGRRAVETRETVAWMVAVVTVWVALVVVTVLVASAMEAEAAGEGRLAMDMPARGVVEAMAVAILVVGAMVVRAGAVVVVRREVAASAGVSALEAAQMAATGEVGMESEGGALEMAAQVAMAATARVVPVVETAAPARVAGWVGWVVGG